MTQGGPINTSKVYSRIKPPELGETQYSEKSDVYMFGSLLHEIVIGKRVRKSEYQTSLESYINEFEGTFSKRIAKIIEKTLDEDPELRPTMIQIIDDLENLQPDNFLSEEFQRTRDNLINGSSREQDNLLNGSSYEQDDLLNQQSQILGSCYEQDNF